MAKVIVQFSGGKDSQACLIKAVKDFGRKNVTAVFCDTGWEHPITYKHIKDVCAQLDIQLIALKSSKFDGFVDMAVKKGRFPSTKARFCTVELKIKPMIDFILSQEDSLIVIQGIRAAESAARSKFEMECSYFKEYFGNKTSGLYNKRGVKEWCKTHDASVLRPIFRWSAQEVIDYILANGQRPNPLYERGVARVGCFPCVMCRKLDARLVSKDTLMSARLIAAEERMAVSARGSSFFPPGYIPSKFCASGSYPTVREVFAYVNKNEVKSDIFGEIETISCLSLYHGLCE